MRSLISLTFAFYSLYCLTVEETGNRGRAGSIAFWLSRAGPRLLILRTRKLIPNRNDPQQCRRVWEYSELRPALP